MKRIILGRVAPISRGKFKISSPYNNLDIVEHEGSSYIAKQSTIYNNVFDTNYWQLLSKKGKDGRNGIDSSGIGTINPSDLISSDEYNDLLLGTDGKLFVSPIIDDNSQIEDLINEHNMSRESHQDIRNLIRNIGDIPINISELNNDMEFIIEDDINTHNISNTSHEDIRSLIDNLKNNMNILALLENPILREIPIAPTANIETNTDQIATTSFVFNKQLLIQNNISKIQNNISEIEDNIYIDSNILNSHIINNNIHVTSTEKENIGFLKGLRRNVQAQINLLQGIFGVPYVVDNYSDLANIYNPIKRDLAFVRKDITRNNKTTLYNFTISWEFITIVEIELRDFLTNPINLSTEVTGIILDSNLPNDLVRKNQIEDFVDKNKEYVDTTKEPGIMVSTATTYWNGLKQFVDFATSVRSAVLTGLSTVTNTVITATDTVLSALGKLQAQLNGIIKKLTILESLEQGMTDLEIRDIEKEIIITDLEISLYELTIKLEE